MYNYNKIQVFPYDPTKLAIDPMLPPEGNMTTICGQNVVKNVSFDDIEHFIEEEIIVTYVDFDCGITFYPETPTKIRQINRKQNYISRSCEKPKCIPSHVQHNCSFDEQYTSNIFLNP